MRPSPLCLGCLILLGISVSPQCVGQEESREEIETSSTQETSSEVNEERTAASADQETWPQFVKRAKPAPMPRLSCPPVAKGSEEILVGTRLGTAFEQSRDSVCCPRRESSVSALSRRPDSRPGVARTVEKGLRTPGCLGRSPTPADHGEESGATAASEISDEGACQPPPDCEISRADGEGSAVDGHQPDGEP